MNKGMTGAILSRVAAQAALLATIMILATGVSASASAGGSPRGFHALPEELHALQAVRKGREIFREDTFGNEDFWGGALRLHEAIAGEQLGGVGAGVSPAAALGLGLKVDSRALPKSVRRALRKGRLDLEDPAVTVELLRLNAVLGVTGSFDDSGTLNAVGITCALCHSTVDDSFAPGIGRRLDGWANQDLNVGAIIAASPDLFPFQTLLGVTADTVREVLNSWGPGKFDASLLIDGKAFRPDGTNAAVLIPPAFGLAGVNMHTWTGWGSVTHWNAFVAVLEMQGKGTFYDPRLQDATKFPVAAANGFDNVRNDPDLVTGKLADLQLFQLAMPAPPAPRGSFDRAAAQKGEALFNGKADCARCHVPPIYTEPGWNLHSAEEMGIDDFQATRGPEDAYRTTPLKGLWTHGARGYFHDGRFATLDDVIQHYNQHFSLGLNGTERHYLVEFLKSL